MDVVVIGGGIVGASAAYHLARAGAACLLIDEAHKGRATAAGAGIINPWSGSRASDAHWFRLANASACDYPRLIAMLADDGETDTSYRRVGALLVSSDPAQLDVAESQVRALAAQAVEAGAVTRCPPQETRRLFPPLRPDLAAIHIEGAARVDGRKLSAALRRAAYRYGALTRTGHAEPIIEHGRVSGVIVEGERIAAGTVIVAAGAWAGTMGIAPQRGQIVHLQLPGMDTAAWPVVSPFAEHYMLAFDDGRIVAGATRETGSGFDYRLTAAGLAQVLNDALSIAPGLRQATILETRIGFRPMAPHGRPILGEVGARGLLAGNGLGPTGLTLGPLAGKMLAQAALGQVTDLDLSPYRP